MKIYCPSCGNKERFLIPLWVRCTFKFNEDGTLSILHVKQLESLEELLTDQGKTSYKLTCKQCGESAEIEFNEYENIDEQKRQIQALEGL
jgi:transcription elongation factor Elf1